MTNWSFPVIWHWHRLLALARFTGREANVQKNSSPNFLFRHGRLVMLACIQIKKGSISLELRKKTSQLLLWLKKNLKKTKKTFSRQRRFNWFAEQLQKRRKMWEPVGNISQLGNFSVSLSVLRSLESLIQTFA